MYINLLNLVVTLFWTCCDLDRKRARVLVRRSDSAVTSRGVHLSLSQAVLTEETAHSVSAVETLPGT